MSVSLGVSVASLLVVAGTLAYLVRRWPPPPLSPALPTASGAALLIALGDLLTTVGSPDVAEDWAELSVLYAGLIAVVPAWWLLALRFSETAGLPLWLGRDPWARVPVVVATFMFLAFVTSPWHGQFLVSLPGRNDYRPLWYANTAWGWSLLVASFTVYSRVALRAASGRDRAQGAVFAGATVFPVIGNAAYVLPAEPLPFDLTPLGVAISCGVLAVGLSTRRLLWFTAGALEAAMQRNPDLVLLLTQRGRLLSANPPAARAFAGLANVQSDTGVFDLLHAQLVPREGAPQRSEGLKEWALRCDGTTLRFATRDRPPRFLRASSDCVEEGARPGAILLRFRDETDLVETSRLASDQAATLEAILGSTDDALCVTEPAGVVRFVNRRFQEMWRIDEPLEGKSIALFNDRIWGQVANLPEAARAARRQQVDPSRRIEGDILLRDGRVIHGVSQPLRSGEEGAWRIWQLRDVTEQRRSDEKLRDAQRLESLGMLAGGVAHDFNNLLVAILGNADLAARQVERGSELWELLDSVRSAGEQAAELTQQLLAYAGRGSGPRELVDLSALVRETTQLLRVSLPPGISLDSDLADGLPRVRVDGGQLRQVLMNLVVNARDSIVDGKGQVRIETGEARLGASDLARLVAADQAGPGVFAFVRVRDDGTGMDAATVRRIFEPFFSTKRRGHGLGLAATLGIVRAHGGALAVESAPGQGSTFTVYLPAAAPAADAEPAHPSRDFAGSGRVLVVDDEEQVLHVAERMLSSAGFEVVCARDGVEAVDRCRANAFRLLLLDESMPRMSGLEALREIRRFDPRVPAIVSSGLPNFGHEPPVAGGFALLPKPYTRERLLGAVFDALGEAG